MDCPHVKHGACPTAGRHTADADLLGVVTSHPNVVIVTRNSHEAEIRAFLTANGVPESVRVCSVKKLGVSKADVILRHGYFDPAAQTALFVDDSIAEHAVADLADSASLVKVLFARS